MTGPATPSNQEGPTQSPPHLPEGWLAQWEGQSKRYYYVQRATGISTWEIPTQPAPSVPTPGPTPQQVGDPFPQPTGSAQYGGSSDGSTKPQDNPGNYQGADRSFLTDMAVNAATGGKHKPQKQSGLGGLASSLLGGGGSHGSGGHSGGSGGIAGQLVGSLLGGGKPQHSGAGGGHGGSSSGASQQGGLLGMASSFLGGNQGGGHQSSSAQNSNYGYSSAGPTSGSSGYMGQAPPTAYQPPNQQGSAQYGASSGQYNPQNTSNQTPSYSAPSTYGQGGQGPHGQPGQGYPPAQGGYGHPNPTPLSPPPSQYSGSGASTPAYGHQAPSYNSQPPSQGYGGYPAQGQQQHYPPPPPPPHPTPSYQGQSGGYDPYGSQHSSTPSQYPPAPSPGYPGQQNYGGQSGSTYGQHPPPPQHQQSGYGQSGGYGGSGAPPAPGWRA